MSNDSRFDDYGTRSCAFDSTQAAMPFRNRSEWSRPPIGSILDRVLAPGSGALAGFGRS